MPFDLTNVEAYEGREARISKWLDVDQESINNFGRATLDADPNHLNPLWAAQHSPFGRTVAFGFQTLAYLTYLGKDAGIVPDGVTGELNYGFDRIRMVEPVHAGARIRGKFVLKHARRRDGNAVLLTYDVVIEIEGRDKPALVAEWLTLLMGSSHG